MTSARILSHIIYHLSDRITFFFFQAKDGIRDRDVTGVQTCALPISGVPYEMKGIMIDQAFPRLKEKFALKALYHKTLMTQGIGESFLADQIQDWENEVREKA